MTAEPIHPVPSRRLALQTMGGGFGYLAFSALSTLAATRNSAGPLAPKAPHFEARAKRVIFLFMRGAPSHVDTFDHKPRLTADSGKPTDRRSGRGGAKLLGSPWEFRQHGESGLWISELFPHLADHADDLCLVNSMHTDLPNHPQATLQMHTGSHQFVRPSMGAWTLYGLGSENDSLPGFVVLNPLNAAGGARNYGSAFLPPVHQGTPIGGGRQRRPRGRNTAEPLEMIPHIRNERLSPGLQSLQLDHLQSFNRQKLQRERHQPGVEGLIQSYELAFRMQDEVPRVLDLSGENAETRSLYGLDEDDTADFGRQCLTARRLAEAGVRFIEINHGNWDHHRDIRGGLERNCRQIDKPIRGLLADLKRRDLLRDTLVVWGGEFGRTPHSQGGTGRDHNHKGFSVWMAGGGVRGGHTHGATDEHGYEAVEDKVHIHDWHATILHLLGLDHERLTYPYAGRDFRLTDVHGRVVEGILG